MDDKEKIKWEIEKRNSWVRFGGAILALITFHWVVIKIIFSPGVYADEIAWAAWTALLNVDTFIILYWLFKRDKEKEGMGK